MDIYGFVPFDNTVAIKEQSLESASGQLGENSGETFQYVIRYSGKYRTEEQYVNIVIKSLDQGKILYLKDVAKIEMGAQSYSGTSIMNGKTQLQWRFIKRLVRMLKKLLMN